MTYNRAESLLKVLNSLDKLELDGATASLEIWIDKPKDKDVVHAPTLKTARDFVWSRGQKRVHVQQRHVGIYGQWIDTWQPRGNELSLILEDDISVSPFAWRWIKAVHNNFGNRSDILGYTLQSEGVTTAVGGKAINAPKEAKVFMNRQMGSWGFAPHPKVWAEFQEWYHEVRKDKNFKPYVGGGVVFDSWYKNFEKKGTQDSMWTIWFIKYTNERDMYGINNNLVSYTGDKNTQLAVHRREAGLHFQGKGLNNEGKLLTTWKEEYVQFGKTIPKYEFNGKMSDVNL